MYTEDDRNKAEAVEKRETVRMILVSAFLLAVGIAFFVLRIRAACLLFLMAGLSAGIFMLDLRVIPARNYRKWLEEVTSGNSHDTVGRLVAIGEDEVLFEGNAFHEVIINIYEDNAEEGVRRFLMDAGKCCQFEAGTIVTVKSHDQWVLEINSREQGA